MFSNIDEISTNLREYFDTKGKTDIIPSNNTIVFLTTLIQLVPEYKKVFGNLLEPLLFLVKEKVGQIRKSAAILMANLCQEEKNLGEARRLHATEVLVNLSQVLLQSN